MKSSMSDLSVAFMQFQGGLIALHVAIQKQTLFAGIILSAANVEVDPKVAGWFTVRIIVCVVAVSYKKKKNF